jgi:hypothetical protein
MDMSASTGASAGEGHVLTELAVPPGIDAAHGVRLRLRDALRPHWPTIAISTGSAVVVAVALLVGLPSPRAGIATRVDPTATIEAAKRAAPSAIYTPSPLPAGFVPDSVHLDTSATRMHLHVGFLTPDFGYAGLEEASAPDLRDFTALTTGGGIDKGFVTISGVTWKHMESPRRHQPSLVWAGPHGTVIVTGATDIANLLELAQSLHLP